MHRVDPIRERGVDLLHSLGKKVIILTKRLTLRLIALRLVGFCQQGGQILIFVRFHLHGIVAHLLVLALLLVVSGRVDGGGLFRLLRRGNQ